ncbi:hypothetical protein FHS40_005949, partial [Streptomyces spectabilis]|nr:hypothetical protein [Streptomyces spectabilis]
MASDLLLLTALIVANVLVAIGNVDNGHPRFGPWAGLGLQVVVVVVLVVRRVWPLWVLGV